MKIFKSSLIVTIIGFILAILWGLQGGYSHALYCVFIVFILSVLEISLSFDNAVVNAIKLQTMTPKWQHRFLTWGMVIAVFGVRFIFPIIIVSIFSGIDVLRVVTIALTDVNQYTEHLHKCHSSILAFGGTFLLMVFLSYMFDSEKNFHWVKFIENKMAKIGRIKSIDVILALIILYFIQSFLPDSEKLSVLLAGFSGLVLFLIIHGLTSIFEGEAINHNIGPNLCQLSQQAGLMSFLYLEVLDASFSFDGVIGAFAISSDIVIICIGLCIGAMFVRSLTIMFVEKNTLQEYVYLQHGAHWAIAALAIIMLLSTHPHIEIPEVVTGLIGFVFIAISFAYSIIYRKNHPDKFNNKNI